MGRKLLVHFFTFTFVALTVFFSSTVTYAAPGDCILPGGRTIPASGWACDSGFFSVQCDPGGSGSVGAPVDCSPDSCNSATGRCASAATAPTLTPTATLTPTPTTAAAAGPPATVGTGGQWAPQPGLNCGKAVDFAGRPGYPTDPADTMYACCYPKALSLAQTGSNFAGGIPGIGSLLGAIIGVVTGVVDGFPFFGADRTNIEGAGFPTVGVLKSALAAIDPCVEGSPSGSPAAAGCTCSLSTPIPDHPLCTMVPAAEVDACKTCLGYSGGKFTFTGIYTGIGCVPLETNELVNTIMSWGIGIAGVSAFACIVYAAFLFQTSQGKPETLQKARELITSCITGLLLIIFSVFILQVIGVDILKIPGLG